MWEKQPNETTQIADKANKGPFCAHLINYSHEAVPILRNTQILS